jgi:large subunit ribosomal protein LP0
VIKDYLKKNPEHPIGALTDYMAGNVGLVFTNEDPASIRDKIAAIKKPAPARIGSIAPVDVFVDPGPTGCDPGQTAWFQALNIPTKINKGQIEMISRVHLLKIGDKVGDSQSALLQKLKILPFSYGMKVTHVYSDGAVYSEAALNIKHEDVVARFLSGLATINAASLGLGYPIKSAALHSLNDAYKAILAIGFGTDYKVKQVAAFEAFFASGGGREKESGRGGGGEEEAGGGGGGRGRRGRPVRRRRRLVSGAGAAFCKV